MSVRSVIKLIDGKKSILILHPHLISNQNSDEINKAVLVFYDYLVEKNSILWQKGIYEIANSIIKKNPYAVLIEKIPGDIEFIFELDINDKEIIILNRDYMKNFKVRDVFSLRISCVNIGIFQ